ncbi:MAG: hypothetical protein ABIK92_16820 [Pseudomonadota bacterium]
MDQMLSKAKQWIDEKKDPRSAHWQAGLEAFMELVLPHLEKGCLTPVAPLDENDLPVFKAALERVDLSPGLLAAFLPPCIADPILPPDSIEELVRIKKEKPSYKIIIQRPGKENRILCAEISKHAHRPGVDIFQSGAFLGNFDYDTHDICIMELTKIIRTHAWEKHKWQSKDYLAYTLNWFEKTVLLGKADVSVDKQHSFFHSPTLVKMNRVDALFLLLYNMVHHGFKKDHENLYKALSMARENSKNKEERILAWEAIAEESLLGLLNLIRNLDLLDFANFTNAENFQFQNEFVRTVRKLSSDLDKI